MRQRAIRRQARALADLWLHDEEWRKFIESAAKNREPGPSQRANVLSMGKDEFLTLLDKTPGRQWQSAVAWDPFSGHNAHLAEIMPKLLDMKTFLSSFSTDSLPLVLAGPAPESQEKQAYASVAWQIFRRELIRYWGKTVNIEQKSAREA